MLILTKAVLAMMIGFIVSVILACFLIPKLKQLKAGQNLSIYLEDSHHEKKGTPTMGGLIFIIGVFLTMITLFILDKIDLNLHLMIILFVFFGYGLIGFVDDYLIIKKKNNKGISPNNKFLFQIIIAVIFFYLFMIAGNEPLIWIHTLNIKFSIGWLYGIFILIVLVASSNAVNITDGLDGLAGGLSVIAFLTFGIISFNTGWLDGYYEIGVFCFVLVGSLLGFLLFNVKPAKIFMGDTGSLSLGATLGTIAILTRHEILLLIIGIVFVIETTSCLLQYGYFKITHGKRLFPITPIHHTFEKIGFSENDIVKMFWVVGLLGAMIAIGFGVWL